MSCGINVILLRGLGRESEHWFGFAELLKRRCAEIAPYIYFTFATPDTAGCGTEYQRKASHRLTELTDDLVRRLPTKTKDACTVVVGLSMGGLIALDLANRYESLVDGVVVINSSTGNQPWYRRMCPQALLTALTALALPLRQRENCIFNLVSNTQPEQARQGWWQIQRARPVSRLNLVRLLLAAAGFTLNETLAQKGLVIASQRDRLVDARCSGELAHYLNWPLEVHPSAGHDVPIDNPEWLADVVAQWLVREYVIL
ncbi:alpha/beta hydrolase family protein [Teredinibacter turnerae T7901]|uniref:Alpha/beta hydrolase family protein n=1 Tax=Teredinibacter turnerae (strain ATCC 39867 / T7901) TaxID=377629 RepID=C5BLD7_TERTT|nr:alpha/beta hydrolase [Teredinibacter turnerae]ACR13726.1 alpha/beta hydrolase family protein [Teredinibacter turnerae T7901]